MRHILPIFLITCVLCVGCGRAATAQKPNTHLIASPPACAKPIMITPGTSVDQQLSVNGTVRQYRLHLPTSYRTIRLLPLVLSFHAYRNTANDQEAYSGLSSLADQQGFMVVYPQGLLDTYAMPFWDSSNSDPANADLAFVGALLDRLQQQFCLNAQRIYATGYSNGGGMADLLACRMPERIAAIAAIAGAFPGAADCSSDHAVPILEFHGTGDTHAPYFGGTALGFPPIMRWLQNWAVRDQCQVGPTVLMQQSEVTGEQWSRCRGNTTVVHYRIDGGGHTWPGAIDQPALGYTTHAINATAIVWQFFVAHPLA